MPTRKQPDELAHVVGARIQAARLEKKFSLAQLKEATGISKGHLSSIEHGLAVMNLNTFVLIASALDVSPAILLQGLAAQARGRSFRKT